MAGEPGPCIIGVDVGGTKIAAALVDPATGAVSRRREIATGAERGPEAVGNDIVSLVESVAAKQLVSGIGIGVPELVDSEGAIRSAYLIDWTVTSLRERLRDLAPVRFESDVRAAALAEAELGAGEPYDLFVYLSLGTGISSTLVQEGVPLVGARGGALVLSTGPLGMPCGSCGAWREFILEDFASGRALAERYGETTGRAIASAHEVIVAATEGDSEAMAIVDSAAEALGSAVGWLVNVLDPEALVVGGGLGLAGGRYWEQLVRSTRAHVWNEAARHLPIVQAALGPDAGLIGAALAARRQSVSGEAPNAATQRNCHPEARGISSGAHVNTRRGRDSSLTRNDTVRDTAPWMEGGIAS